MGLQQTFLDICSTRCYHTAGCDKSGPYLTILLWSDIDGSLFSILL